MNNKYQVLNTKYKIPNTKVPRLFAIAREAKAQSRAEENILAAFYPQTLKKTQ